MINTEQLSALPSGGRSAFLFAVTVPTVVASGDSQFNRQQDQTNASLLSLGGGTRRGNNYLIDGVPITDLRNRASANPTIEALAGRGRAGPHLRRRDRAHRRRHLQHRHQVGRQQLRTAAASTRPVRSGATANNFFAELAGVPLPETYFHLGGGGFGGPIIRNRTFFWVAAEGYGSNTTRNGNAAAADRPREGRRLLAVLRRRRPARW